VSTSSANVEIWAVVVSCSSFSWMGELEGAGRYGDAVGFLASAGAFSLLATFPEPPQAATARSAASPTPTAKGRILI
jgi:hypothetical protein